MGLFGKKYKTDASGNKVRIADKGYEKEYFKKTKKYVYDRTGSESKAATLKEAKEEAAAAKKMPITEGWKSYDQDTRVEVPTKRSFKEKRNIFGGKAGKAKNKKPKADIKIVRVKNEKQAAKAHKKRDKAGLTKEREKTTTKQGRRISDVLQSNESPFGKAAANHANSIWKKPNVKGKAETKGEAGTRFDLDWKKGKGKAGTKGEAGNQKKDEDQKEKKATPKMEDPTDFGVPTPLTEKERLEQIAAEKKKKKRLQQKKKRQAELRKQAAALNDMW